jgi:integrase
LGSVVKQRIRYAVQDVDRHGNVRIYVRVPGKSKVRIRAAPDTTEFWEEYHRALGDAPAPGTKGTLQWLCDQYFLSAEYKALSHRTRRVRRAILDRACIKDGGLPFKRMEPRHVRARRDQLSETPEAANGYMKALRQVFAHGIAMGYAQTNPVRDVPYLKGNPEGFHTWTLEEVEQFEAHHATGSKARLALALLLYTGVRRSDVVQLGRQMEREGWLHFVETKGRDRIRKERAVPILPELRTAIDACPSGHMTYLVTSFGKPYTANGFGNWWRRQCNAAGLSHCAAHGLRKAGATIAAENGATEHQLMAIYGWESPKQAAIYTRRANRKRLAGDAMHLIRKS